MPGGRPSTYNYDICKEICERVSNGENVTEVINSDERYPSFPTWCTWKREHPEIFKMYINALNDKVEVFIAEIDEINNAVKTKKYTPSEANVMIQTLKWKAAKFYPKMFGEKLDLTTDGEKIVTQSIPKEIPIEKLRELLEGSDKEADKG
jgi:hypothetical protein